MTRFQRLSLATAIALYLLVVLGGAVRVTNSGLSCIDWPKCNGRLLPNADYHVLLEWSHRLVASFVSVLIVLVLLVAWRSYRRNRAVVGLATALTGVLVVQIGLGGATVTQKLSPEIVSAHLGTAMLLFATSVLLALAALSSTRRIVSPEPENGRGIRRFSAVAWLTAACMYVLLISGAYTASSGAGLSCSTWPLCNGQLVPHSTRFVEINFLHRSVVVVVSLTVVMLVVAAWSWLRDNQTVKRTVWGMFVLFLCQILLGALNVWTRLLTVVQVAHLATAAAIWGAAVAVAWMAFALVRSTAAAPASDARPAVRGAVASRSQEVAG